MAPRLLFVIFGALYYLGITVSEEPIQKANLKSIHIISDIKNRIATTVVSMKYYNPHNSTAGKTIYIMMPLYSSILNSSMEIDGYVTEGEKMAKSDAEDSYKYNVEKGQSSVFVEVEHRYTKIFDISVIVEPQKYIVFNLTYEERLKRQDEKYSYSVHVSNFGIIDELLVEVTITEPQDIIRMLVPKITDNKLTDITVDKELDSAIINKTSRKVYIKYNPSRKQQEEISEKGYVAGLFNVEYDVERENNLHSVYKANLESLHIISDIKYRYATTLVSMTYYNPYNFPVNADFYVRMPLNSFISNFSMEIDGNVTVGEVMKKSVAKDIYDYNKEIGQSSGHVEVKHRFTSLFDISVNVEPKKYIVYNLTYQELLTRQNNKYRHDVHVSIGGVIDNFLVEVYITEPQDIIDVSVPKITNNKLTDITVDKELDSALIKKISSREVYIKYNPSYSQQEEFLEKGLVAGVLKIQYDVDHKNDHQNSSNLIYAVDGYFVHFFTSDPIPNLPKHIIFMLDVSESMAGRKIEQMSEAIENILDQLDPELDKFLIGKFSSEVSWMEEEFLLANNFNKNLGKNYTKHLQTTGSTNINAALLQSIEKHKSTSISTKKSIIVFLTNGSPTEGVTDLKEIKKNVREANEEISLFTLCFGGKSINKFFRELATENGGFNRKIYEDSDSKIQIENLYKEISNILLKDITFVYLDDAVNTSTASFSNYFKGSELVVSGVLPQKNETTINVDLTMTNHLGPIKKRLELQLYRDDFTSDDGYSQNFSLTSIQSFSEITEKTYAYLTLKQLLMKDKTNEVRHDILNLALKYNFVTPLTSMVVTKHKVNTELFEEETLPSRFVDEGPVSGLAKQIPELHYDMKRPEPVFILEGLQPDYAKEHPLILSKEEDPITLSMLIDLKRDHDSSGMGEIFYPPKNARTGELLFRHNPGILIKPLNCSIDLCFTDTIQCRNQTEILLLADEQAGISVYGSVKNESSSNCLETLNRLIIRKSTNVTEIVSKPQGLGITFELVPFKMTPTFSITVNQYKSANAETFLSVHFNITDTFVQAGGILSDYVTEFQCIETPSNRVVLSNKREFNKKVIYPTSNGGSSHCFSM